MAQSIKWLFVYGTLLSRSRDLMGRDMRQRLQRHCLGRRPAAVSGLLYDLGGYPGWVEQQHTNRRVTGELLLLNSATEVCKWLDPYENFDPMRPDEGEYIRDVRQVLVSRGESKMAWLYRYRGDLDNTRLIQRGSWLDR